jgi:drug/metabolite transporter (DMT)-like permease
VGLDRLRLGKFSIVIQFILLAFTWGASFFFIKIGLQGLSPAQVVWTRIVFGALTMGLIVLVMRQPIPRDVRLWGHLFVVAILLCVVPFMLISWAEQHISSGLASIYHATTPLLTVVFAVAVLSTERLTRDRVFGLVLGFVGVLTVIGVWQGLDAGSALVPQLAVLGANTSYGVAYAYLRRYVSPRGEPVLAVAFIQVTMAACIMLLTTPWLVSSPVHLTPAVVLSMITLGVVGTGLAYIWNTNVVGAWGATNGSAVTYLTPIVGVVLGVVVLGEPLSWHQPVGAVLVIMGVLASHGRFARRRPPAPQQVTLNDLPQRV